MKTSSILTFVLLLNLLFIDTVSGQTPIICIPAGTSPTVDGVFSSEEWDDSDSVQINIAGDKKVTVKYKHNNTNLYFAYLNNLEPNNLFPEILFDINNDKSSLWLTDDWWFHISATDCDSKGAPNNYSNCKLTQTDWVAVPNFTPGPPITNYVEISIPFEKLNVELKVGDTLGIAFDVSNTFNIWNYWPQTANYSNPSTWATAIICSAATGTIDRLSNDIIKVNPNPATPIISITTDKEYENASLSIQNTNGTTILDFKNVSSYLQIDTNKLSAGTYIIVLKQANKIISTQKLIVR